MIISSLVTILILSTILYFGLHKSILHPIEQLTAAAERIETQDYQFSLPQIGKSSLEIRKLFNTFERMRQSIQAYLTNLKLSEKNTVL